MTFPAPFIAPSQRATPTYNYIGRATTTGDGFPAGSWTSFTSGTKLVVVCLELAGANVGTVQFNGNTMNNPVPDPVSGNGRGASIWTYETTATSGSITGTGGSGRSSMDVFEMFDYASVTPQVTGSAYAADPTDVVLNTSSGMLVFGSGVGGYAVPVVTADKGPTPQVRYTALEGATSHFSWVQDGAVRGPTTFTADVLSSYANELVVAGWR